ncbi:MAG: hypothetical protein GW818_08880 [Flavobacteriales bacterium]|nr:hypothetical protein [Flavobacteriales bacterium]PJC62212.1 MAG: hypothetical protein CO022_05745 [Flavobacteriales bacterium CG_4_9_14_0_2_um_filter_32_27]
MLKYRLLTSEELRELEEEFKHFLIINQIYDDEWKLLNQQKSQKVEELIVLFSNLVIEKALKKIAFLEIITNNGINAFYCKENEMELIGISTENKQFDFTLVKESSDIRNQSLSIFKTSKPYFKTREIEVFNLINSGCSIISSERYKKLELAYNLSIKQFKN